MDNAGENQLDPSMVSISADPEAPRLPWKAAHPSLKFSLLAGALLNMVVLCGAYEFYRSAQHGPVTYCERPDALFNFAGQLIGVAIGLPFCIYGTVFGPWKSWKLWVWLVPLAVLLNLLPFWVGYRFDWYVVATHNSVTFDGCD
jgi:hypothetical protein